MISNNTGWTKADAIQAVRDTHGAICDLLAGNCGLTKEQRGEVAIAMVNAGIAVVISRPDIPEVV